MERRWLMFILGLTVVVFFASKPTLVAAATGTGGSQGAVLAVEGSSGIIGWAKGTTGNVIDVDVYVTRRGDTAANSVCSQGGLTANQTVADEENRIGNHNGQVFVYKSNCLENLSDGDYDIYVALGPNLWSAGTFQFTVKTLDVTSNSRVWLHYLGKMIDRSLGNYDSYPTVMKDGAIYKMWYVSGNGGDNIFYATSSNGVSWNLETGPLAGGAVLAPTVTNCVCNNNGLVGTCTTGTFAADDMHTADPSVVKVNGVYYMYYTGASKQWSCFGSNNHVYLATSTDGINWIKYKDGSGNLIPIMSPLHPCTNQAECSTGYGAGQSSVIYKDGMYTHYFTDLTNQTMGFSMGTSLDGNNFGSIKNGVMGDLTWDIKYSTYLGNYFGMVSIPSSPRTPGTLRITTSSDGVNWKPTVNVGMGSILSDINHYVPNNGGLLSDPTGIISGSHTVFYTGAGWGMQDGGDAATNSWDIIGVDVWFSKATSGDANGDGHVDGVDYVIWLNHFGQSVSGVSNGDFDNNGRVDGVDYVIWLNNFGASPIYCARVNTSKFCTDSLQNPIQDAINYAVTLATRTATIDVKIDPGTFYLKQITSVTDINTPPYQNSKALLYLPSNVNLIGSGPQTILHPDSSLDRTTVMLYAGGSTTDPSVQLYNVTIRDFVLDGLANGVSISDWGLVTSGSSGGIVVQNVTIRNTLSTAMIFGRYANWQQDGTTNMAKIYPFSGTTTNFNQVVNNTIQNIGGDGIEVIGENVLVQNNNVTGAINGSGVGIGTFVYAKNILIKNNTITHTNACIGLDGSYPLYYAGDTSDNAAYQLLLGEVGKISEIGFGNHITMDGNTLSNCDFGVHLWRQLGDVVINNSISNTRQVGIQFNESRNDYAVGNKVNGGGVGIKLRSIGYSPHGTVWNGIGLYPDDIDKGIAGQPTVWHTLGNNVQVVNNGIVFDSGIPPQPQFVSGNTIKANQVQSTGQSCVYFDRTSNSATDNIPTSCNLP